MNLDEKNVNVVKSYFAHLAKGEMEQVGQLIADDIVWHQPGNHQASGTYKGKQELFPHLGKMMEMTKGTLKLEPKYIMANNDLVSVVMHFSAQRDGASMSMDGVDLLKVQDGKIKEVWLFSEDQEAENKFWGR
jgi:ketosteroid isomerase-like protein